MATDFFELQDRARRHTKRLVLLFGLAVIGMAAMLYLAAAMLLGYEHDPYTGAVVLNVRWLDPLLMLQVGIATSLVVGGASLYRMASLSGGGRVVAEGLAGKLIHANTEDPLERRILNIVEEMAIASGIPTPPVYLMQDEEGINAFAAGYTPSDAVIGLTRGCADQLSRDELQGVIAHEFSHILNGDMRLNIRLMGVLFGILVIGLIGNLLLRSSMYGSLMRSRNRRDNSTQVLLVIGFVMMCVGFVGTFVGNLLKASVSRQREFLADASAVQFTRNPSGIAGALKKIGNYVTGSEMKHPSALESSHLFFGRALSSGLNSLFATHPPLDERIARLDPSWGQAGEPLPSPAPGVAGKGFGPALGFSPEPATDALAQIGNFSMPHLQRAGDLIGRLAVSLIEASHEPYGARALVYGLLMNSERDVRRRQFELLRGQAEEGVPALVESLLPEVDGLETSARLPLIDLALPALRGLSKDQYRRFRHVVGELVLADAEISLFEWVLQRLLLAHLRPHFEGIAGPRLRRASFKGLADPCAQVFSALVAASSNSDVSIERAFSEVANALELPEIRLLPFGRVGFRELDSALDFLSELTPPMKKKFLSACARLITADHEVTPDEAELFRAIADSLGCPMPPLLPDQPLIP